jgi:gamma-glutamylputrescine oxidase
VSATPFWLARPLTEVSAGILEGPVDVVVVGGGVTGCSAALTLARGGLRVRLIEGREIAGGASGRNGGFALRGLMPPYDEARALVGGDTAASLWELTERAIDEMEALAGDALRRTGSVRLAVDAAEREALAREYAALLDDGFAADWHGRLEPPLDRLFEAALVHPRDAALSPALWVRRLAGHAADSGAEIVQHSQIGRAEIDGFDATTVLVAVDGLTDTLVPELARWLSPVRGQVLATEPLPELLYGRPHYSRWGYDYWQQTPAGRLILGGRRDTDFDTERTAAEETTPAVQNALTAYAEELMGGAVDVTHRWAGIWGETPDRLPFAGRVPGSNRVWVAGGYSGHGNVLGFACGDLVARAILGEPVPALAAFDPARMEAG